MSSVLGCGIIGPIGSLPALAYIVLADGASGSSRWRDMASSPLFEAILASPCAWNSRDSMLCNQPLSLQSVTMPATRATVRDDKPFPRDVDLSPSFTVASVSDDTAAYLPQYGHHVSAKSREPP